MEAILTEQLTIDTTQALISFPAGMLIFVDQATMRASIGDYLVEVNENDFHFLK